MTQYEIQSTGRDGNWSADYIGSENLFDSVEDAEAAIVSLQALGGEWAEPEYRVNAIND